MVRATPLPLNKGWSFGKWLSHHWLEMFLAVYGLWVFVPFLAPIFMQIGWHGETQIASTAASRSVSPRSNNRIMLHTTGCCAHQMGNLSADGTLLALTYGNATTLDEIHIARISHRRDARAAGLVRSIRQLRGQSRTSTIGSATDQIICVYLRSSAVSL